MAHHGQGRVDAIPVHLHEPRVRKLDFELIDQRERGAGALDYHAAAEQPGQKSE